MDLSGWDAAAVLAKAIAYAATLGAAGGLFFLFYSDDLLRDGQRPRVRRLVGLLMLASAVASGARIPLLAGSMSGDLAGAFNGRFIGMILGAGEGRASGIRIAGLILAAAAMRRNGRPSVVALLGAVVAATSFAWVGHAHAAVANRVPTLLLCLHLLCVAFWIGALAPLYLLLRDGKAAEIAATAARFGKIAIGAVGLLIVAGAGLLWVLIRSLSDLWTSGYGLMVVAKLLLVIFLLALAGLNKLYLTPLLLRGDSRAVRSLARSIKAEMFLACLILLVTAAFTTITGPPK